MNKNLSILNITVLIVVFLFGNMNVNHAQDLTDNKVCIFEIAPGSPFSGKYIVEANEDQAFAYNDVENDQFAIEIHSDAYIDMMLIIENLSEGEHPFSMEYQVAIDISKDEGENYRTFHNRYENKEGHINIELIDKEKGFIQGSFSGLFFDDTSEVNVELKGTFRVRLE